MPKAKYKAEKNIKTIDQLSVAKLVATRLGMSLPSVLEVIELEQKLTMQHVRNGFRVIKKNYVTFTPIKKPSYVLKSKLDGQHYEVPDRVTIRASLGQGFKAYVANQEGKMPEKICRFVDKKVKEVDSVTSVQA